MPIIVFIGAGLGGVLRFLLAQSSAPLWGTFIANVLGCFFIGLLSPYFQSVDYLWGVHRHAWLSGFLGGLTTFSTFQWETLSLIKNQNYQVAALYFSLSLLCGVLSVFLGVWLGSKIGIVS